MNLIDLMAAVVLTTLVTMASLGVGTNPHPQTYANAAVSEFQAQILRARELLSRYPGGLTIAVTADASGDSSNLVTYAGRPLAGSAQPIAITHMHIDGVARIAGASTFALFMDSTGKIDYQPNWVAWTPLAAQPGNCGLDTVGTPEFVAVTIDLPNNGTTTRTLSCEMGTLQ